MVKSKEYLDLSSTLFYKTIEIYKKAGFIIEYDVFTDGLKVKGVNDNLFELTFDDVEDYRKEFEVIRNEKTVIDEFVNRLSNAKNEFVTKGIFLDTLDYLIQLAQNLKRNLRLQEDLVKFSNQKELEKSKLQQANLNLILGIYVVNIWNLYVELDGHLHNYYQGLYKPINLYGLDLAIDELRVQTQTKPQAEPIKEVGFNLGLDNPQLESLFAMLLKEKFISTSTDKNSFINAFNGSELNPKDFKPIEWIDITPNNNGISMQTVLQLLDSCNVEFRTEKNIDKNVRFKLEYIFSNDFGNIQSKYRTFKSLISVRHKLINNFIHNLTS